MKNNASRKKNNIVEEVLKFVIFFARRLHDFELKWKEKHSKNMFLCSYWNVSVFLNIFTLLFFFYDFSTLLNNPDASHRCREWNIFSDFLWFSFETSNVRFGSSGEFQDGKFSVSSFRLLRKLLFNSNLLFMSHKIISNEGKTSKTSINSHLKIEQFFFFNDRNNKMLSRALFHQLNSWKIYYYAL